MGKVTGFLEYQRKKTKYKPVKERIKHFNEFEEHLRENDLQIQAARCMDCGIPYCHSIGCPLNNLIPEFNDLIYRGLWKEAYERLEMKNTLPEMTGRVCPALCETSCTLAINNGAVTIKEIELAIIEKAFENNWINLNVPEINSNKKVAIIGSGPSGLAAAIRLRKLGYNVTVFEKMPKAGGILRYGIPNYKLEKWVIDRRINVMKRMGIEFEEDVNVGEDVSGKYLKKIYDAILITTGAGMPRDLNIPGRDLKGIFFAMEYLTQVNKFLMGELEKNQIISAKNKNVLVIGGGDTGSDCIGTARRQGAKNIYQIEILPKPKEWKETYNPEWPDWPKILRTSTSHEEGAVREWSILTKEFKGEQGKIKQVVCARLEWERDKNGKWQMKEIPNSTFVLDVDLVFLAMGFLHVEHGRLVKDLKLELDSRGNIKTNEKYATNVKGVFVAGDANTGASLVVRAINHGQNAALAIDEYLSK